MPAFDDSIMIVIFRSYVYLHADDWVIYVEFTPPTSFPLDSSGSRQRIHGAHSPTIGFGAKVAQECAARHTPHVVFKRKEQWFGLFKRKVKFAIVRHHLQQSRSVTKG